MLLNTTYQDIVALDQQAAALRSQLARWQEARNPIGCAQVRLALEAISRDRAKAEEQHHRLFRSLGGR